MAGREADTRYPDGVSRLPRPQTGELSADSVYFFMWPGWRDELESNRWHWSKRWARRLPVVLIQPELAAGEAVCAIPEPRLENVELLSIEQRSVTAQDWLVTGLRQAGQIARHMRARGHQRPLFWFYNPHFVVPYALLPSRGRVFHATENYFDFPDLKDDFPDGLSFLNCYRYAIEASDLVICCSSGIADSLARNTRRTEFLTLPNGCDFLKYSEPAAARGDWPASFADWQQADRRLAVFAGGINNRLDFALIETLVARHSELGFVFAGPVELEPLSAPQLSWERLQRALNVCVLGRIPTEDLPALYWCCDVGFIPYRTDLPMIVENGFPLKALEMAAAGLPVVATLMKPLREVSGAVTVAPDAEAFCVALSSQSRRHRSAAERKVAEQICRAYDYDLLFEQMAKALATQIGDHQCRPADLVALVERIGLACYNEGIGRFGQIHFVTSAATFGSNPVRSRARNLILYRIGALLGKKFSTRRQKVPCRSGDDA
jgi:glycosyltransferase involved in cell wall biosynthesis